MRLIAGLFFLLILFSAEGFSQASTYIDDEGVMRWTEGNEEVCAFGTNYSVPFAYWDAREPIGADYEKAIDEDVYHIARLGLDGYRIHVWESYISDTMGNLVYNRHFQLFDYLLFKLKQRGIKAFITPMYLSGGNTGFTHKYGKKAGCLSDSLSFPAQANYLSQFVSHVNPYTGIAYKDDPDIIAFEIVNEPGHWKRPDLITGYINFMYDAIRATGCKKPLFYNMSTSAAYIDKIMASKADGGSLQWYPTGLTSNHDQKGNMLPNVDSYIIPFDKLLEDTKRPKFVYEFSPSDIGASSHLYPAMARSFREAGFQFAAHFAYDPMHAAYCNIEYRTHFLNLAYTPKKAIGLMIASQVFHELPLGKSYGPYPENLRFESFSLSYEKDLAEMVSDKKFLYTNHTLTVPPKSDQLEQVAGTGSSPIVSYAGTGAYFLDKLEDGVWRLEVMPDAHWVRDPFFVPYVDREVAVTCSKKHAMIIKLPGLGSGFEIQGLNEGNELNISASGKSFSIMPGAYLLSRRGETLNWDRNDSLRNIQLKEFHMPGRKLEKTYFIHNSPVESCVGQALKLEAKIVAPFQVNEVEIIILGVGGGKSIPMVQKDVYNFEAEIPEYICADPQVLRYHISIKKGDAFITYPSGEEDVHLLDRRIYSDDRNLVEGEPYQVNIVGANSPVSLFDASSDWRYLTKMKRKDRIDLFPSSIPGKPFMHLAVADLNNKEHDYTVRSWCRDKIEARMTDLKGKTELIVFGNALNDKACILQVALLMKDGTAYGGLLSLDAECTSYPLKLKDLKQVNSVLLPRPYPGFQNYWFEPSVKQKFDLMEVESLQISIGPGIAEKDYNSNHGVAIGWVTLK